MEWGSQTAKSTNQINEGAIDHSGNSLLRAIRTPLSPSNLSRRSGDSAGFPSLPHHHHSLSGEHVGGGGGCVDTASRLNCVDQSDELVDPGGHWPILNRKEWQITTLAHRVVRQQGFLVALASGLAVLAVSLVQNALNDVIGQLSFPGTSGVPAWQWWAGYATQFAPIAVPLALGVVLSFWFIATIGPICTSPT